MSAARDFHIAEHDLDGSARRLTVAGDIDLATAPILERVIEASVADGKNRLEFDLTEVAFLDSSALEVFVRARRLVSPGGGGLILRGVRPALMPVFELTGLVDLFDFG